MSKGRKSISKKLRFEVFKRDNFTCQYCGAKTPNVVLEIDHIQPISKGGDNSIDNLVTSCFDCNRGKSNRELSAIPNTIKEKAERIKEIELQYKEYKKILRAKKRRIKADIDKVEQVYQSYFKDYYITDRFKNASIKQFINKLDLYDVMDAMEVACLRIDDPIRVLPYFCAICWNRINN